MLGRIAKSAVIAIFASIAVATIGDRSLSVVSAEEVHPFSRIAEAAPDASVNQSTQEGQQPNLITASAIIAAFASVAVAMISAIVSLHVSRRQLELQEQIKTLDLDAQAELKRQELNKQAEALAASLRFDQESLRQAQLTEILKKRLETYPALYRIISEYGRNWEIQSKVRDSAWATVFLNALLDNNASNGVFFSDRVYGWYGLLRSLLEHLTVALAAGRVANDTEVSLLDDIIRGPVLVEGLQAPGLGSYIKDELGSYIIASVSAVFDNSSTYERCPYTSEIEKLARNNIESRLQRLNGENHTQKAKAGS